jgi:hypothetical protein
MERIKGYRLLKRIDSHEEAGLRERFLNTRIERMPRPHHIKAAIIACPIGAGSTAPLALG